MELFVDVVYCFQVRIWNMKSVSKDSEKDDQTHRILATLRDHFGSVNCVRWAKHGRHIASGSDDQVILIHERRPGSGTTEFGSGEPPDIENWKVVMTLRGHTADVVIIHISAFNCDFSLQRFVRGRSLISLVLSCTLLISRISESLHTFCSSWIIFSF